MRTVYGLKLARRVLSLPVPRPSSTYARWGLAYERKLFSALLASDLSAAHNPAFYFEDRRGRSYCVPDILVQDYRGLTIIVECKLTFKQEAIEKLRKLYCPVVRRALGSDLVIPLVIVKNIVPDAPSPALTLESALSNNTYLIQWLGRERTFPIA